MKKKLNILFCLLSLIGFSQENEKKFLKVGIYETFADFSAKLPNREIDFTKSQLKNNFSPAFQLRFKNGKRIKKAFCVSDGENVYVKERQIKKLFKEKNRGNPIGDRRDYLLAYLQNDNFLYFENYFYSTGTALLGVGKMHLRGIIYDSSIKKFIVFKYGTDIKEFLSRVKPSLTKKHELTKEKVDIKFVRNIMLDFFERNEI